MHPTSTMFEILPIYQVESSGTNGKHYYYYTETAAEEQAEKMCAAQIKPILAYTVDGGKTCLPFVVGFPISLQDVRGP